MPALYGWGSNVHGQLARPLRDVCAREIVHISPASAILAVSATQVVFRDHDQAFVLGGADCGLDSVPTVTRTEAMGRAIGQDEILAYLNRGHVYFPDGTRAEARCTWRDAAADLTGQRGDPWLFSTVDAWLASDGTEKTKGMLLSAHGAQTAPAFRRVDAGGAHFLLLSEEASTHPLYAFGDNRFGQLGDVGLPLDSYTLHPVPFFSPCEAFPSALADVACGNRHSVVRTKDGDCYGWGWIPDADGAIQPPFLLDLPTDVAAVACGASNTYFLLTDNTLWGIGSSTSHS